MDLAAAKEAFAQLYEGVAGYDVSHRQRQRDKLEDRSLIYGEVLPEGFHQLLVEANIPPGGIFYDLGAGTGKAIFLAAMMGNFSRLMGWSSSDLVDTSRTVLERFDAKVRPNLSPQQRKQKIELVAGDLLAPSYAEADLIFTHSTCFETKLLDAMGAKMEEMRPGTKVIGIGRRIPSDYLQVVRRTTIALDWGSTFGVLYERINS